MFGNWANYYIQSGRGRSLERLEVLGILERANRHNLVLQPSNAQDISFICCCCGCCCGVLRGLKAHPRPAEAVASAFISQLDPERCDGCWTCLDRCQMQALLEDDDRVRLDGDRCIGCGLCVTTCPNSALHLVRKPANERTQPPRTLDDTWRIITRAQAEFNQAATLNKENSNV